MLNAIYSLVFLCSFSLINPNIKGPEIEKILEDFVADKDCSKLAFSGNLLSFKNKKKEINSEIELFQLYIFDEETPLYKVEKDKILKMIKKADLELLNMIKSDGNHIEIYVREENEVINNVLMFVFSEDSSVIFHAKGKIKYSDLKNLNIDFDGAEELKKY